MQWWPRREPTLTVSAPGVVRQRMRRPFTSDQLVDSRIECDSDRGVEVATRRDEPSADGSTARTVTTDRIRAALDRLDVRYLTDGDGALVAMWERHAVLIALEGPEDEILMMRARPHATVPRDWADRAYRAVNEWNHSRRFAKAYVGDPTDRGQLPIYAEVQVPLRAGVHETLLTELLDCGVSVSQGFVEWLHNEGGLL